MANPRIRMYFRSLTMPLLLVSFVLTGYSGLAVAYFQDFFLSGALAFLSFGIATGTWAEIHSFFGLLTIALVVLHVLFEFKTLLWSIKFVFSRPAAPKKS